MSDKDFQPNPTPIYYSEVSSTWCHWTPLRKVCTRFHSPNCIPANAWISNHACNLVDITLNSSIACDNPILSLVLHATAPKW